MLGSRITRVVHVIGALAAGGAERFVVMLLQAMRSSDFDVRLVVLSNRSDTVGKKMREGLSAAGISFDIGPTARLRVATVLWYANRMRQLSPDIVHLHTPNTELCHLLYGGQWLSKAAICRTLHNTANPTQWMTLLAYRLNCALTSIACSEAVAAAARKLVAGKLITITNGVCFDNPIRDNTNSRQCKEVLGWDTDAYHFIQVGRMTGRSLRSSQKAHDVVLKAWARGRLGERKCMLHIVGDGDLRSALERRASGDSSIQFHGICQDIATKLLAADCFVMPSREEGLPIAGIEAVGAGLPCIFTEIAPLQELRAPLAFYVPVDAIEALSNLMGKVAATRPSPTSHEIEEFRQLFSIRKTAEKYLDVYYRYPHGLGAQSSNE